jgi:superfamily II DNA/RNA helicase
LTETTTASREPTDATPRAEEPSIAEPIVADVVVEATDAAEASPDQALSEQASSGPDAAVGATADAPSPDQAAAEATRRGKTHGGDVHRAKAETAHAEVEAPHAAAADPVETETRHDEAAASPAAAERPVEADPQHLGAGPHDEAGGHNAAADHADADRRGTDRIQASHDGSDQPSLILIEAGPPPEPARAVFADLGLSPEVLRAIDDMGYRHPTPIQEQAIPYVLMGRDVMGTAQTGTGKTAGFTLPMLDILSGSRARARMPRSLILEPTRELALQVAENFVQYGKYLKLTHALIIGGESMSDQKDVLNRGVDVLIATPGRLLDMFDRGTILLSDTKLLVIDEADRMLDMGFIPDVERIVSMLPATRQTLFFSATMGPEIRRLVDAFLTNPKQIAVSREASVATTITEGLALVAEHDKREALRRLIRSQAVQNALIFCNRKRDVDILHKSLSKHNFDAGALHGDLAQTVRFATLEKFKANELRLLVCSDVAARGIDIGGLSHVFNFDVPIHAEDYVHRIGRTGRAGLEGKAFTIASPDDRYAVEQIEKLIGHPIPPVIVEGLDPVDWAEGGRKRRGRKAAEPKKPAAKGKTKDAAEKAEKPRAERKRPEGVRPEGARPTGGRSDRGRPDSADQPELAIAAERPSRRDETRRPDPRRSDARARDDAPKGAETRGGETRGAEARRPDTRHDEARRDEPRRDDHRRERYRRDDDLGPAVVGFGDDVPAFMLLRARPPQMAENRETDA